MFVLNQTAEDLKSEGTVLIIWVISFEVTQCVYE